MCIRDSSKGLQLLKSASAHSAKVTVAVRANAHNKKLIWLHPFGSTNDRVGVRAQSVKRRKSIPHVALSHQAAYALRSKQIILTRPETWGVHFFDEALQGYSALAGGGLGPATGLRTKASRRPPSKVQGCPQKANLRERYIYFTVRVKGGGPELYERNSDSRFSRCCSLIDFRTAAAFQSWMGASGSCCEAINSSPRKANKLGRRPSASSAQMRATSGLLLFSERCASTR